MPKTKRCPRLRNVDKMRIEHLSRCIAFYENYINDPRVSPDFRNYSAERVAEFRKEIEWLKAMPDSAYDNNK